MAKRKRTTTTIRKTTQVQAARKKQKVYVAKLFKSITPAGPKTPFPPKRSARLKYFDQIVFNLSSTDAQYYVFTTNGPYDPNFTATGHQPRGWDQYMAMYSKAHVMYSTCKVIFTAGDNSTYDAIVGVYISTSPTPPSGGPVDFMEGDATKAVSLSPQSSEGRTVWVPFSTKKWSSVKDILDDESLTATASGNPPYLWYYHVFAYSARPGEQLTDIAAQVVIEYSIIFTDPIQPSLS